MDIYIIRFTDGQKEEYRCFAIYRNRITELESLGYKKGEDYKVIQLWL